MIDQASFTLRGRNPDVLTCIANLSNDEEREFKSKRKLVQEKLIKFATRMPAFMYLTDFRENTL